MSTSYCQGCDKSHEDVYWRNTEVETEDGKLSGWFCSRWFKPQTNLKTKLEEYATPFWKIAGQKPRPEEKQYDQMLKKQGKTYYEAQQERLANEKVKYDSSKIKKQLYKGTLKTHEVSTKNYTKKGGT